MDIIEEVLSFTAMHRTTKGVDIFDIFNKSLSKYGIQKEKISSVCSGGAPAMTGKIKGFLGCLKTHNFDIHPLHCAIHQEALASKCVFIKDVMNIVVNITNSLRGGHNALTHRKFKSFLKEIEAHYGDLLLHTEVRWLSKGNCLARFFELKNEILLFLKQDIKKYDKYIKDLEKQGFLIKLAFLADISSHFNILNLSLQGKFKHIFEFISLIHRWVKK